MKPYFQDDAVTIYHGDCREIVPTLGRFDLLLTDPPYGIGFCHGGNDKSGIGKGRYSTKFAGVSVLGDDKPFDPEWMIRLEFPLILWGANHYAQNLPPSPTWLVWDKRAASRHTNDFADCELAWSNIGGVARMFRHQWDGMMKASERGVPRVHPTQKPLALMIWCISLAGDAQTILDPFAGSGTTGRAAKDLGRKAVLIEREERYCEIAARRMAQGVLDFGTANIILSINNFLENRAGRDVLQPRFFEILT